MIPIRIKIYRLQFIIKDMIKLQKVIPLPLLEIGLNPASNVYNTEGVVFEPNKNYLLSAASGKGKSTLIHAIYGLRNDYQGDIFWDTKNLKDYTIEDWAIIRQKNLAIVFQDDPPGPMGRLIHLCNAVATFSTATGAGGGIITSSF